MNYLETFSLIKTNKFMPCWRVLCGMLILAAASSLSACDNKDKKAGQTLVRVNGEEITMLQVNDELRRADVNADQRAAATSQLLNTLIDRQLLVDEAMRNKIHRTPEVMQAVERAKAKITEQAYLESITAKIAKPTLAEINEYFKQHPEYFTERKQVDIQQLIVATRDVSAELKLIMNSAKSLDMVAVWLDKHKVRYSRGQLSRNTADLPEQIVARLTVLQKGDLFIVNEGENSLLNSIYKIKNSPVTAKEAAPQIEQYLIRKKSREAVGAEVARLRLLAKIDYLNASAPSAQ